MALSPDDVAALARLARIELTGEEQAHLAPQLDVILEAVASVTDAKSLPGVGVWPGTSMRLYLALLAALGVILSALAVTVRRTSGSPHER